MKKKKVKLDLVGLGSNSLLEMFQNQAKQEGWTPEEIEEVISEATSGDYNHMLSVLVENCDMILVEWSFLEKFFKKTLS